MKYTYSRIQAIQEDLVDAEEWYLRERGWVHSSEHPDSVWRWSKQVKDRNYTMTRKCAIDLQIRLDQIGTTHEASNDK